MEIIKKFEHYFSVPPRSLNVLNQGSISQVRVDSRRGGDVPMAKDALDGGYRYAFGEAEGRAGHSSAVHGDVLPDAATAHDAREDEVGLCIRR